MGNGVVTKTEKLERLDRLKKSVANLMLFRNIHDESKVSFVYGGEKSWTTVNVDVDPELVLPLSLAYEKIIFHEVQVLEKELSESDQEM